MRFRWKNCVSVASKSFVLLNLLDLWFSKQICVIFLLTTTKDLLGERVCKVLVLESKDKLTIWNCEFGTIWSKFLKVFMYQISNIGNQLDRQRHSPTDMFLGFINTRLHSKTHHMIQILNLFIWALFCHGFYLTYAIIYWTLFFCWIKVWHKCVG